MPSDCTYMCSDFLVSEEGKTVQVRLETRIRARSNAQIINKLCNRNMQV